MTGSLPELLQAFDAAQKMSERSYLRDQLAHTLARLDAPLDMTLAERCLQAGVSADLIYESTRPPPPHAVAIPLVTHVHPARAAHPNAAQASAAQASAAQAMVVQFVVTYDVEDSKAEAPHLRLGADAALQVRWALEQAARVKAPPRDLAWYRMVPLRSRLFADAAIDGESLGLATYLSAVAYFSGAEVPRGLACTGRVVGDQVLAVANIQEKVKVCAEKGYALALPAANLQEARALLQSEGLEVALHPIRTLEGVGSLLRLTSTGVRDFRDEVDRVSRSFRQGWEGLGWRQVRDAYTVLLGEMPVSRTDLFVEVCARCAATLRHLGQYEQALMLLRRARAVLSESGCESVPDAVLSLFYQQRAMTELRTLSLVSAEHAARVGVRFARRSRDMRSALRASGTLGLVLFAQGRAPDAIPWFEQAWQRARDFAPREASRSASYLIEALGEAHFRAQAEAVYVAVRAGGTANAQQAAWLDVSLAKAFVSDGAFDDARALLVGPAEHDTGPRAELLIEPLPGLLAFRELALAYRGLGRLDLARAQLRVSLRYFSSRVVEDAAVVHAETNRVLLCWLEGRERAPESAHAYLDVRDISTLLRLG